MHTKTLCNIKLTSGMLSRQVSKRMWLLVQLKSIIEMFVLCKHMKYMVTFV